MKILNQIEAPLLNRTRVVLELEHLGKSTPKKEEIQKEVSTFLKESPELISIKHVYSKYGIGKSKVIINVYKNAEDYKKFETKKQKKVKNVKTEGKEQKAK